MPQMTGGHAVVDSLQREGIEVVFGLPGVQIMHIYDGFYGRSDIRLMTVRHEQASTYMADGYVRVTGRPSAAALVVPGPGVQNATAGLGTAYSTSSPVLLVAGQIYTHELGRDLGGIHEINDQLDVVRPITKWCHRILQVEETPGAIHEAMHQMKTGRPRPTAIEIPPDILASTAEVQLMEPEEYPRATPDPQQIRRAAELLIKAKKPLIWAGGGVVRSGASEELTALAEALKTPVVVTAEGKGAISEDHPLYGGVGYYGHGDSAWLAPRADLLLAVGTRLTSQMRGPTTPRPPQQLIHIDVDQEVIGKNYPAEIAIVADAKAALGALARAVQGTRVPERWPQQELDQVHTEYREWLQGIAPVAGEIINAMQKVLDDDAIYTSGITYIGYWSHFFYKVRRPRTYFNASYYATLGYGFPFALGTKVAAPDKQVVCVAGDGGFTYGLSELATAVQYGINLVTLVFVDNALGSSLYDQQARYSGRVVGTELHNPDFALVAEAFGAKGMKTQPENVGAALAEALESKRPVVIEVPLPGSMVPPFQAPLREE